VLIAAVLVAIAAVRVFFFSAAAPGGSALAASPELLDDSVWQRVLEVGIFVDGTSTEAPITVVEFVDLECPYCRESHLALVDAKKELGDSVAHVVIHYPLSYHRFAVPAARAAECADREGRFPDYVDLLLEKQDSLGLKTWLSYAVDSGVKDTLRFAECNAAKEALPRVEQGLEAGSIVGVEATPTILINGWRVAIPPLDAASFVTEIRRIAAGAEPYDR